MKILHLLSYHLYTGPAEPVLRLARAQRRLGHDARLAIDRYRPGDLAGRAADYQVPLVAGLALSVKAGPLAQLSDMVRLRRLLKREWHVVHCHRTHDHVMATLAAAGRRGPLLLRTVHAARSLVAGRGWLLRRADGVITICRQHRQQILRRGWQPDCRVLAIEGVVEPEDLMPADGDLRRELGVRPDAPLAGMVARMKPGRGHELLLSAWRRVAHGNPRARLLLAGRGEEEHHLRALVAGDELLAGSVVFAGYRRDLGRLYRTLDLKVILAPGNDGTCRAALEAMACGVPVLAPAVDALAEIVEDNHTGRLLEAARPELLAEAILDLLGDRGRLRALGRNAAERARERFTMDRQVAEIMDFIERLQKPKRQ
ncbi:MAG: glycosyltransferase family 1 protein [Deltaproteobacteria bacterium]|nr:MAG: glycosyltransferase family 1 protein [Deltaproteobacteria bacterium]